MGQALFANGLGEQGVAALTEAARLAGDDAEAWFQIGQACLDVGRGEAAGVAIRRAHTNDPLHPGAALAVAQRMRLDGEEERAETALLSLLDARLDCAAARLELAAWLTQEGRGAEALALLDVVSAPPDLAGAWAVRRAHALLRLARPAEARAVLAALGGAPASTVLAYHHARLRLAAIEAQPAVADEMEAALGLPGEDAEFRIAAHFHLGRFWLKHEVPTVPSRCGRGAMR